MLALQFSLRTAALRAGQAVAAATVIVAPAMIAAQPASARFPVTEQQRQTAGEVAQAGVPLSALAPNAPDAYTVKRGDTLWGISTLYLTSPWRWPELWGMNKEQIANPHLIYPGQTLRPGGRGRRGAAVARRARPRRRAGGHPQHSEPDHRTVPVPAGDRLAGGTGALPAHRRHPGAAGAHRRRRHRLRARFRRRRGGALRHLPAGAAAVRPRRHRPPPADRLGGVLPRRGAEDPRRRDRDAAHPREHAGDRRRRPAGADHPRAGDERCRSATCSTCSTPAPPSATEPATGASTSPCPTSASATCSCSACSTGSPTGWCCG